MSLLGSDGVARVEQTVSVGWRRLSSARRRRRFHTADMVCPPGRHPELSEGDPVRVSLAWRSRVAAVEGTVSLAWSEGVAYVDGLP